MVKVFKRTGTLAKLVGEATSRRKFEIKVPTPKEKVDQRNKKVEKNKAKKPNNKKSEIRKKNSKEREQLRILTQNILSLSRFAKKDVFEKLKNFSKIGLIELKKLAETMLITGSERKKNDILKVIDQIEKVQRLQDTLRLEQLIRDGSESRRLKNRELTAGLADKHPLGKVIGKVNIVEYKAPGSITWATPRKKR